MDGNGNWLNKHEEIISGAINNFQGQLNGQTGSTNDNLLQLILSIIAEGQKEALEKFPTKEEILETIKSLPDTVL